MPVDPLQSLFNRHLFNHYAYSGMTAAVGVALVSLVGHWVVGDAFFAMTFGALCVAVNDVPSPVRHKFLETSIGLVLGIITTLIIGFAQGSSLQMGLSIFGTSFIAAMITVYGRKAMPLSFSIFLTMMFAMILPLPDTHAVITHTALFAFGGSLHLAYAMAISHRLNFRTRQQALGESVQALAGFMRNQATFLDTDTNAEDAHARLIGGQSAVAEKIQIARDLVFRHLRNARDGMLAATLVETLTLYEHLLSAHTDYVAVRQCLAGSDLLLFLRDIALKGALDLEHIGYTLLRGEAHAMEINYKAEIYAIEYEIGRRSKDPATPLEDLAILNDTLHKVRLYLVQINRLRAASCTPIEPQQAVNGLSIDPFLSRAEINPRLLFSSLRLQSPVFRYSLRIALAMTVGYLVDLVLPYTSHGYWILATIAVVMRSSFSLTRTRYFDRVAGNLIGCVLAALLLWVTQNQIVILGVLFASIGISHAYATQNFRVTAVASCVMGLLPAHFLDPGSSYLIAERLLDTVVGAGIAYGFSFVLPNWEKGNLPQLVREVLRACRVYAGIALQLTPNLLDYRVARKQAIDAMSALAQASQRMRDEPLRQHATMHDLNALLTASHMMASQLASVHIELDAPYHGDNQTLVTRLGATAGYIHAVLSQVPPPTAGITATTLAGGLDLRLDALQAAADEMQHYAAAMCAE